MSKISRKQSREAALHILFAQSFTDAGVRTSIASIELTRTIESLQAALKESRELARAATGLVDTIQQSITAIGELSKPATERKIKPLSESPVVQLLYSNEKRSEAIKTLKTTVKVLAESEELFAPNGYTIALLTAYDKHRDRVVDVLGGSLEGWSVKRLTAEDSAGLRLGITELLFMPDTPPRVIINEYIELAKSYGDDDAPKLVNGVLDRVLRDNPRE